MSDLALQMVLGGKKRGCQMFLHWKKHWARWTWMVPAVVSPIAPRLSENNRGGRWPHPLTETTAPPIIETSYAAMVPKLKQRSEDPL